MIEWISVKDRLPTRKDADAHGEVLYYCIRIGALVLPYDYCHGPHARDITHWARIVPPVSP